MTRDALKLIIIEKISECHGLRAVGVSMIPEVMEDPLGNVVGDLLRELVNEGDLIDIEYKTLKFPTIIGHFYLPKDSEIIISPSQSQQRSSVQSQSSHSSKRSKSRK